MKAYFLTHSYFDTKQAGIQSVHAGTGLAMKYALGKYGHEDPNIVEVYTKWATDYETVILLKGGDHEYLSSIEMFFKEYINNLTIPWYSFKESMSAANGCLTCIGLVLSEKIYKNQFMLGPIATRVLTFDSYLGTLSISATSDTEFEYNNEKYVLKPYEGENDFCLLKSDNLTHIEYFSKEDLFLMLNIHRMKTV